MDDNQGKLGETIAELMADFFMTFNFEPFPINISFTNDLWETYFTLRPDHKSKFNGERLSDNNGTVVPPLQIDENYTILVDINYLLEDIQKGQFSWIGTIIHETTHARDFIQYTKLIGAQSYDEVLDTTNHRMFHTWTEFNARRHGYYFVRKYSFSNIRDDVQLPFILQTEIPYHIDYMFKEYHSTTDAWMQIYVVTQFIGRLSVWKELFPQYFTYGQINELFSENEWMYDFFRFLDGHQELSEAYKHFEELRKILQLNFQGVY